MDDKKEKTVPKPSVGADEEQSKENSIIKTITDVGTNSNNEALSFREIEEKFLRLHNPDYLKTISMTELYDTVFQSSPPIIDGLLCPGTYLFVGAPKLGKSFLMAQLAYHVSTGTPIWHYPVRKGTVLYLALEDDYSRLQKRLYRMFGAESTENLHFSVSAGHLGKGLDEQLSNFVTEHPDTVLIIIDTLQKVRETGGESYSYANDYEIITRLKQFADKTGICLMLVHHTRKQQAEDRFDMISGTNGLLGAADGAFLLQKEKRTGNTATLDVSGRDQPDQRLHLIRDNQKLTWELERIEKELWKVPPEPLLEEIAKQVNEAQPDWQGTPTALVEYLGLDMKPNALTMRLNVNAGRLYNEYGIRYESSRNHEGRRITLHYDAPSRDGRDDRDGLFDSGTGT